MKITIITVCRNSILTIKDTLASVWAQDYKNLEYIVIDGDSTDGTKELLEENKAKFSVLISEKDHGMYHALNKGLELARGEVIGILNADDFYVDEKIISKVAQLFQSSNADGIYADLVYVDRHNTNKIIRTWHSGQYKEDLFLKGWMPPHPTFFVKKKVYEKFGVFNTSLTLSADYELMLRFIQKNKISLAYLPEVIVRMRAGGSGDQNIFRKIKANKEDRVAWRLNNLQPGFLTLWRKPFSKIVQYFK